MFKSSQVRLKRKVPGRPVVLGQRSIILEGKSISYTLKRSFRAKLIWLNYKHGRGLGVTVPQHYNLTDLPDFLERNSRWIIRHHTCTHIKPEIGPASPRPLDSILYLGQKVAIVHKTGATQSIGLSKATNELVITQNSDLCSTDQSIYLWMKAQAVKIITAKVRQWSSELNVEFSRITIRNQKSRWGSCSRLGNLSFNWRLIMVPEDVLDYVVIHELCHLKEMNHSRKFWEVVGAYCPCWREHRRWINHHRVELHSLIEI